MKPLVLFHDNCADGFGAAFAAWLNLALAAVIGAAWMRTQSPSRG